MSNTRVIVLEIDDKLNENLQKIQKNLREGEKIAGTSADNGKYIVTIEGTLQESKKLLLG